MADELNKQDLQEEVVDEVSQEEKEIKEEEKEANSDTALSEETSEKIDEVVEEKTGEISDVPPPSDEEKESAEESDKSDVEPEEKASEDDKANESETKEEVEKEEKTEAVEEEDNDKEEVDVDALKAEVEAMKEAEEERKGLADLSNLVQNAENEMNRVLNGIQKALNDTLDQYGIDKTKTLDELKKEDPAKAVIAEDLIRQANQVKEFNENNLGQQVQNKQNELIFKKAEKLFNKYNLSHEQAEVAADTFINIMLNVGVLDLNVDLAAKVELAAARAKMLKPDVVEAVDVKAEENAPVEDVEEVVDMPPAEEAAEKEEAEKAEENTEEKKEEQEKEKKPEVKIEKPDLEALKEGVAENTSEAHHPDRVTVDNVLAILASVPFKERTAFYKEHEALINEAAKKRN